MSGLSKISFLSKPHIKVELLSRSTGPSKISIPSCGDFVDILEILRLDLLLGIQQADDCGTSARLGRSNSEQILHPKRLLVRNKTRSDSNFLSA